MVQRNVPIPEPNSRFVEIECGSCNLTSIVFSMAKSTVNCKFCGNLLAEPTGGKAKLFGKLHTVLDDLSEISVKTAQTDLSAKTARLLLDTMIIHRLLGGESLHELAGCRPNQNIELVVLDRILIETKNMEKYEYDRSLDIDKDIVEKLKKIGPVEIIQLDHASDHIVQARELFESKKYANANGVHLSEADCILLCTALKLKDVRLVTQDQTLLVALEKEKKSISSDYA